VRVVYASYDGALDPLGASQVLPYLEGLSRRGVGLRLVTFEKPERSSVRSDHLAVQERLAAAGIAWRPLPYHRRPRVPATLLDVMAGMRAIAAEASSGPADIVHCRGDVAMAMARWSRLPRSTRLLYDVRALFSEERVESGSWRRGSLLDRAVKKVESGNLWRADGIVVLTEGGREALVRVRPELPPHRIIPTCVDLDRFRPRPPGQAVEYGLVYSGSLGGSYMTREMVAFARASLAPVPGRPLFLTPQLEDAHRAGVSQDWAEARSVRPAEVPEWLRQARALFFFRKPTPANRASCPTKLAEALATGLPVVANRGVGDLDEVLEKEGVGVLVDSFTEEGFRDGAIRLSRLLQEPGLEQRCRRLAELRYGLPAGVEAYHRLYHELCARAAGR